MMTQRWTIRTVPTEIIEIIRTLSHATGKSAGRLVTEAILSWVRNQPEAEICEATDTAGEWDNLLADLEKQVTIQSELLRELHVHFGVPYIGNDPTHGGQSNDGTCVVNARARNASAGSWMVDCQPHKVK